MGKAIWNIDVLAIGFATTVAMWAVGYFTHIPSLTVPGGVVFFLLVICMICGGVVAGMYSKGGWIAGLYAGLLSAILNMLVLGSLLANNESDQITQSALIWIPGSILLGIMFGTIGGLIGANWKSAAQRKSIRKSKPEGIKWESKIDGINWKFLFSFVAASAAFFLIFIGGLVTSNDAGLAVVDWPNSFGRNMFLYPLSRMTGGIYYEHAHRLFGSLVGLTTIVLMINIFALDSRRLIRNLSVLALVIVVIQGIMGGLRVTGIFTFSTSPDDVVPNIILAVVHGVTGQIFFGLLVAITVMMSKPWKDLTKPEVTETAAASQQLNLTLIIMLVIQLTLGALLRHIQYGLIIHITFAIIAGIMGITCGARAWGMYQDQKLISQTGTFLIWMILMQVILGMGSLGLTGTLTAGEHVVTPAETIITTAHQSASAILIALSTMLYMWSRRLLSVD